MPSKEQESSSILSIRLPDELIQRLDRYLDWWETARRVKSSRNAVMREALSQWLEVHEHEAGLVHMPILRQQFQTAVRRMAHGPDSVPIYRLRQVLQQTPPTDPLRIWSVKPTGFFEGNKILSLSKTMVRSLWRH